MRSIFVAVVAAAALWLGLAAAAQACPVITTGVQSYSASASELARPAGINLVAGGNYNLGNCYNAPGHGYVISQPDISLYYNRDVSGRALEIRTAGNCDTVLLVNTGAANWYFDDDDGNGLNARIRLSSPSAGRYDIWVGTYGASTCNTQLVFETFR